MPPLPQHEPIAIVGIGCRLPGQVTSPSKLWQMLMEKRSGHCPIPASRFRAEGFYHPNADRPGSINSTTGYFLDEDIHAFENAFFGINNKEATSMDAQQRKLLEVAYESLESAGVPWEKISGSNTGVFVANFTLDHMIMQYQDPEYFSRYSATGSGATVLSNRITHCFDLKGPSSTTDTACSSSMYSLHAACSALDTHECEAAFVASANLIQSPEQQLIAVKAGILSPDGVCHTFDAAANGYGRGEAVSCLYLKRLSDAVRDGDPVRCVIRGTAVNGNGKTPGITQPSIKGQAAVIRKAYARAGLPLDQTDYVEAHGTGTKVGDPIEVEAISTVLQHRDGGPTLVGGIKPNLGHSEGASGLSGILKVALALEHDTIPATIGVDNINANIHTNDWNVAIATEHSSWPASECHRASINSFGFGGSNSHVILEAAEPYVRHTNHADGMLTNGARGPARRPLLLPLSAKTASSLSRKADDLQKYVHQRRSEINCRDLSYTLSHRRSILPSKGYMVTSSDSKNITTGPLITAQDTSSNNLLPLAFVFTGQGAQWPRMAIKLIQDFPTFRESLHLLDSYLADLGSDSPKWTFDSLISMPPETSPVYQADISQPLCTAVQIALVDLLRDWSIQPEVVLGHSSGEIAAAYTLGAISRRQAIYAAYFRGRAVTGTRDAGAMLAAGIDAKKGAQIIEQAHCEEAVSIAALNSPESITLSGDKQAIDELHDVLKSEGTFVRKLQTNNKAYHSHHMRSVSKDYQGSLEHYWHAFEEERPPMSGTIKMISTVTGIDMDMEAITTPEYWKDNLVSAVQFEAAIEQVFAIDRYRLVEVGPHRALELPIKQTATHIQVSSDEYDYHPTLVRQQDCTQSMLALAGSLFLYGHNIKLDRVNGIDTSIERMEVLHDLPTYPWDYAEKSLWTEPRKITEFRQRRYPRHDLLGSQIHHGNSSRTSWRNVLSPEEVPWLRDHCLGPTMVFPAAAYLAMAVESACQVNMLNVDTCPGVEVKSFSLLKALHFTNEQSKVDIFTDMTPEATGAASSSRSWWRFRVHSVTGEECTEHVNGLVRLIKGSEVGKPKLDFPRGELEPQAARTWYSKFTAEGLSWGPKFAVMEQVYCDRDRKRHISSANTRNVLSDSEAALESRYMIHPINIDGMLQTAFVATTGGVVRDLRATVPVTIGRAIFTPSTGHVQEATASFTVDSVSRKVGFGTVNIDAELKMPSGDMLLSMSDVRCIAYAGNAQAVLTEERSPLVRVAWKPDIRALSAGKLDNMSEYFTWFATSTKATVETTVDCYLLAALDLVTHLDPNMRILELSDEGSNFTKAALDMLRSGRALRSMQSYVKASVQDGQMEGLEYSGAKAGDEPTECSSTGTPFDVVVVPSTGQVTKDMVSKANSNVDENTILLTNDASLTESFHGDWSSIHLSNDAVLHMRLPRRITRSTTLYDEPILLVCHEEPTSFDLKLQKDLQASSAHSIKLMPLLHITSEAVTPNTTIIATIEAQQAILRNLTADQMDKLKILTDTVPKIIWITNCNIMKGEQPDSAVVQGLARALMLEQPSLTFSVFDVDDIDGATDAALRNVRHILSELKSGVNPDFEYAQHNGVLHSLRWVPEDHINGRFRARQSAAVESVAIKDARSCRLAIDHPGQLDSLHFIHEKQTPLGPDEVRIKVMDVSINAKDLYALAAKVDTKDSTCSCECAGIVDDVGPDVDDLKPGDRVVAMAPGHFGTFEQVPRWACLKLKDKEDLADAASIPLVYATAIYAFKYRARLLPDETVLIHSAAGGVGIAAIQLAQKIGAKVFATVGTQEKKDFLVHNLGLDPSVIFNSRDSSFLPAVLSATGGRGIDVVLNSLTGELLHSSLEACAEFGRFVEIGKRDILDHGSLDMAIFQKNISFMAFDLSNLFYSSERRHHDLWQSLIQESIELFRSDSVQHITKPRVFDASNITEALRHFSSANRTGKVVVSFENQDSLLQVVPERYDTEIDPEKAYLMVGCLGGLGRSISKWMATRGANKFVFLGRSGTAKPEAKALVEDLERSGCSVTVVQGDVAKFEDVQRAVASASAPIGGVVQAAMGLSEALWTSMTCESWHTAVDPKVKGTWNLHNALLQSQKEDVDFFVLTSSISGTVGTATESNYCSGNAFLDSFARYRNGLGLNAVSIGLGMISEVGYLHEHPDIEKLLIRKGIHAINEDELLQILDLALSDKKKDVASSYYDSLVTSHLLTGIEFVGLKAQRDRGFEGDNHVLADPRASLLAAGFRRSTEAADGSSLSHEKSLPAEIKTSLAAGGQQASVLDAVRTVVATKVSNLILLPTEQLPPEQHLSDFGIDSMLAAEFRTYIFHTLEVDVPFMTLLGKTTTVNSLTELIVSMLEEQVVKTT